MSDNADELETKLLKKYPKSALILYIKMTSFGEIDFDYLDEVKADLEWQRLDLVRVKLIEEMENLVERLEHTQRKATQGEINLARALSKKIATTTNKLERLLDAEL